MDSPRAFLYAVLRGLVGKVPAMSGPGRIQEYRNPRCFLLYNFDIASSRLKSEHRSFLQVALPAQLRPGNSISIVGLASRTASEERNLALSNERVARTLAFFQRYLPADVTISSALGLGEVPAAQFGLPDSGRAAEDQRFRAVVIFLDPPPPPPPPPPTPVLPPPPPPPTVRPVPVTPRSADSTHFRVRIIAGASVSLGVGVEAMQMDILDVTNSELCVYEVRGFSFSGGTPVALSLRGPWNDFHTVQGMRCGQFGGLVRFGTVFVMDKSVNALTIEPFGYFPIDITPFETGWTLGAGIGVGAGTFTRMFPPIPASEAVWPHNVD
jgi:hypothetical protein